MDVRVIDLPPNGRRLHSCATGSGACNSHWFSPEGLLRQARAQAPVARDAIQAPYSRGLRRKYPVPAGEARICKGATARVGVQAPALRSLVCGTQAFRVPVTLRPFDKLRTGRLRANGTQAIIGTGAGDKPPRYEFSFGWSFALWHRRWIPVYTGMTELQAPVYAGVTELQAPVRRSSRLDSRPVRVTE